MSLRDCERMFAAIAQVSTTHSTSETARLEMITVLAELGRDALREARERKEQTP